MDQTTTIKDKYDRALASFLEKATQDPYLLAVVLLGSLSYDTVWELSDIDLWIITQEVKIRSESLALVEDGINIHASVITRSKFRKLLEGAVGTSFAHSAVSKGKLVFCRDQTLTELFAERARIGSRDREVSLLRAAVSAPLLLAKAKKWLVVRKDVEYSFFWILLASQTLASIEVTYHNEAPTREVLQQALAHNPVLFKAIYTDLIHGPKTLDAMQTALSLMDAYLIDRRVELFRPIFEYLRDAHGVRSATEIETHFSGQMDLNGASFICEWLADLDFIRKVSAPIRLTEKSRVDLDEAAYYFDEEIP